MNFIELNLNFIELNLNFIELNLNFIELNLDFVELKLNFIELKLNYGIEYCYNRLAIGHPTFFYQSQDEFRTKESEFVHFGPITNEGQI